MGFDPTAAGRDGVARGCESGTKGMRDSFNFVISDA